MKTVPLGSICEINMGQAPSGESYNNTGTGYPLVAGAGDFGEMHPNPSKFTASPTKVSQIGDIILCIRATIGDTNWSDKEYCLGRGVAGLRPIPGKLDPAFAWYAIKTSAKHLSKHARGSTFLQVSKNALETIPVPFFPLAEQRRIAAILDKADAIRRKRQQSLALLDDLLRSTFLDMFGDPNTNPRKWPTKCLKEIGRVVTGGTPPGAKTGMFGGAIPFITPGDLESDEDAKRTVTVEGAAESRTVRAGSALVCCIGATIGKMSKARVVSAFNQQINAVEWGASVDDDFGLGVLRFFKGRIAALGISTTLPILKKSSFERIEIPLPPLDLQDKYASTVRTVGRLKDLMGRSSSDVAEIFASLLQRAFKGEL